MKGDDRFIGKDKPLQCGAIVRCFVIDIII